MKIAFCFLIYDIINHEKLWYNFFKGVDKNKYSIHIHYKKQKKLKHFENKKLGKTVKTDWCDISLVEAQNLLLQRALQDKKNQQFIFVSNSCIPVKSFKHIYDYLTPSKSYFNMSVGGIKGETIDSIKFHKASQWCILNRKHADIVANTDLTDFKRIFEEYYQECADEYIYPTILINKGLGKELIKTRNKALGATTFVVFGDTNYKFHPKTVVEQKVWDGPYMYKNIHKTELNKLIKSKSLFARKFDTGCESTDYSLGSAVYKGISQVKKTRKTINKN